MATSTNFVVRAWTIKNIFDIAINIFNVRMIINSLSVKLAICIVEPLSEVGDLAFYRHEKIDSVKRQILSRIFGNPVRFEPVLMIHEKKVLEDEQALYDTTVRNDSVVFFHI